MVMTPEPSEPRFQLVIGAAPSDHADAVLEHAFDQALRHDRPTLHVAVVVGSDREAAAAGEALVERVRRVLDEAVPAERRAGWSILLHVRSGAAAGELADLAAEVQADLLVIGRFGEAPHDRKVGSLADRIVGLADCPVLVVTPPRDRTASDRQCPDCVEVRRATGGEQWFCDRHHGEWTNRLVEALPSDTGLGLW